MQDKNKCMPKGIFASILSDHRSDHWDEKLFCVNAFTLFYSMEPDLPLVPILLVPLSHPRLQVHCF
jgi:hypothetical protein